MISWPLVEVALLARFCLYGFLKNQQYYDAFLILAFLAKGLSFFQIGLLVAVREVMINILEVVSGALADVWGRRASMIASHLSYMTAFVLLGLAHSLVLLVLGMALLGVGDAFRTGTHKAMIFDWLRSQGRADERTRIYGLTRSWSKIGSAVSVVLASVLVLLFERFDVLFFAACLPYALGILNFLGYPKILDHAQGQAPRPGVWRHLIETLAFVRRSTPVRRLMLESMAYEGTFKAAKDYLQPVLQAAALIWLGGVFSSAWLGERGTTAILVGPVFFGLFLLSALASRRAHHLVRRVGSEARAARIIWLGALSLFGGILAAALVQWHLALIVFFVGLYVLQNLWRPILIGRFDAHAPPERGATILSLESQAKSLATVVLAPVLGVLVDLSASLGKVAQFWPVAALGLLVALVFVLPRRGGP